MIADSLITALIIINVFASDGRHGDNFASVQLAQAAKAKPNSYRKGDPIKLWVGSMTSAQHQYPWEYYKFPFCKPDQITHKSETAGDLIKGARFESTPYSINMLEDVYCQTVCSSNVGRASSSGGIRPNKLTRAVEDHYHTHWWLDGLYAAAIFENDMTTMTWFADAGIPLGVIPEFSHNEVYLFNHYNFLIFYNNPSKSSSSSGGSGTDEDAQYNIVRFEIEPFSINHTMGISETGEPEFINPIKSCDRTKTDPLHTAFEMVHTSSRPYQPSHGEVIFTYDVIWTELPDVHWSERWDIYNSMDGAVPEQVFRYSSINSIFVIFGLLAILAYTVVKIVRVHQNRGQDSAQTMHAASQPLTSADASGTLATMSREQRQAILLAQLVEKVAAIQGDVFRPPNVAPRAFAVACGTGAQLLAAILLTMGYKSTTSVSRDVHQYSTATTLLWSYALSGIVGGYVAGGMSKYLCQEASDIGLSVKQTAFAFPAMVALYHVCVEILAWWEMSTLVMPFSAELYIIVIWLMVGVPLVYVGGNLSGKHFVLNIPNSAARVEQRPIPRQKCMNWPIFTGLLCGVLSFGPIYVIMYFATMTFWFGSSFDHPKTLLFHSTLMLLTVGLNAVFFTLQQFANENHRWWWRSFFNGGSVGIVLICWFSIIGNQMELDSGASAFLYFFTNFIFSFAVFLIAGFVGFVASFVFTVILYGHLFPSTGAMAEDEVTAGYAMLEDPLHLTVEHHTEDDGEQGNE